MKRANNILVYGTIGLLGGGALLGLPGAIIGTIVGAAIADDINSRKKR